ncbi:MAG: hypothetical protein V1823_02065 [Chloroflexota bacterium]
MAKRKIPPSRFKYDKNHPTVSARLPKEKHEKLLAVLKSLDVTLPQLLLQFIGEYEVKVKPIDEAGKTGFVEAKNLYMITYPCSVCGKPIPMVGPKAKEIAGKYMAEHGWRHSECHKRKNPQE